MRLGHGLRRRRWRHDGDIRHSLRPKFNDSGFKLSVDAPKQRARVEIEHRAVSVDDAARLRPRRQRIKRALLKCLDHLDRGGNPRGKVCFGQVASNPQVPKQLGHFRIRARRHFCHPVKFEDAAARHRAMGLLAHQAFESLPYC